MNRIASLQTANNGWLFGGTQENTHCKHNFHACIHMNREKYWTRRKKKKIVTNCSVRFVDDVFVSNWFACKEIMLERWCRVEFLGVSIAHIINTKRYQIYLQEWPLNNPTQCFPCVFEWFLIFAAAAAADTDASSSSSPLHWSRWPTKMNEWICTFAFFLLQFCCNNTLYWCIFVFIMCFKWAFFAHNFLFVYDVYC